MFKLLNREQNCITRLTVNKIGNIRLIYESDNFLKGDSVLI